VSNALEQQTLAQKNACHTSGFFLPNQQINSTLQELRLCDSVVSLLAVPHLHSLDRQDLVRSQGDRNFGKPAVARFPAADTRSPVRTFIPQYHFPREAGRHSVSLRLGPPSSSPASQSSAFPHFHLPGLVQSWKTV
jgi:hypothetical protein